MTVLLSRRSFLGRAPLVALPALVPAMSVPEAQAIEEPTGENLIRKRMWDMAYSLYQHDRGHWRVAVDPDKHFALFVRLGNEPQNGLFFTELQP